MKVYTEQANCPYCGYSLLIAHNVDFKSYSFICNQCAVHFTVKKKKSMTTKEAIKKFRKHDWSK